MKRPIPDQRDFRGKMREPPPRKLWYAELAVGLDDRTTGSFPIDWGRSSGSSTEEVSCEGEAPVSVVEGAVMVRYADERFELVAGGGMYYNAQVPRKIEARCGTVQPEVPQPGYRC